MLLELLERRPLRVEQERPALLEPGRDVVLMDVFLLVAGDEVGRVDEIGGLELLRFEAGRVRPQGRAADKMASISLHETARVIAAASVPADLLAEAVVVTVAGGGDALPGMGTGSVKVTPLERNN